VQDGFGVWGGAGAPAGPQRSTMVERQGAAPTYNGGAWAGRPRRRPAPKGAKARAQACATRTRR
jgi:hypothetical protein